MMKRETAMARYTARRENIVSPKTGDLTHNFWVVRDEMGEFVEVDRYQNDLKARYGADIEIIQPKD
jgi:hypothetical protein